jgi:hypothetical protein
MTLRLLSATLVGLGVAGGCASQPGSDATATVTMAPSTVTVSAADAPTPPASVQPSTSPQSSGYSQEGVYAVGTEPSGGLQAAIPPGRYRVEWKPNEYDFPGSVIRCSHYECGPTHTENLIALETVQKGQLPSVVDIAPTDVAVHLSDVTLTPVT